MKRYYQISFRLISYSISKDWVYKYLKSMITKLLYKFGIEIDNFGITDTTSEYPKENKNGKCCNI